jgi:hypothetical protein
MRHRRHVLTCEEFPHYTFSSAHKPYSEQEPFMLSLSVGVKRGTDRQLLIQLSVGEYLEFKGGILCQIVSVDFSYSGRRAEACARVLRRRDLFWRL